MEKTLSIIFYLILITSLISIFSCPNDTITNNIGGKYQLYKNFNNLPDRAQALLQDGEPIVGVLLKYTSEGAYGTDVYPIDKNTFCIYCLFDNHGFNGDGMEFNYVLYIPEDIQNQYIAGGGKDPDTGNPFWWYMLTYQNSSIQNIQNDWQKAISTLCNEPDHPEANSADVTEKWKM